VTYHWVRSDGTSTGSQTVSLGAGQTGDVTDSWTPPADTFSGSDALDITSPVSQTASIPISLACTGSHVLTVTIVQGTPDIVDSGNMGFLSYTVTVTTEGTGPVSFDWNTSAPAEDIPSTDMGSVPLSGSTSYAFVVSPPSGFFDGFGCNATTPEPNYVFSGTATGTDMVGVTQTSSFTLDCQNGP
jgi:hypothetical protein